MNNIFLDYNDVLINPNPSKITLTRKMIDIKMDIGNDKVIPIIRLPILCLSIIFLYFYIKNTLLKNI